MLVAEAVEVETAGVPDQGELAKGPAGAEEEKEELAVEAPGEELAAVTAKAPRRARRPVPHPAVTRIRIRFRRAFKVVRNNRRRPRLRLS